MNKDLYLIEVLCYLMAKLFFYTLDVIRVKLSQKYPLLNVMCALSFNIFYILNPSGDNVLFISLSIF